MVKALWIILFLQTCLGVQYLQLVTIDPQDSEIQQQTTYLITLMINELSFVNIPARTLVISKFPDQLKLNQPEGSLPTTCIVRDYIGVKDDLVILTNYDPDNQTVGSTDSDYDGQCGWGADNSLNLVVPYELTAGLIFQVGLIGNPDTVTTLDLAEFEMYNQAGDLQYTGTFNFTEKNVQFTTGDLSLVDISQTNTVVGNYSVYMVEFVAEHEIPVDGKVVFYFSDDFELRDQANMEIECSINGSPVNGISFNSDTSLVTLTIFNLFNQAISPGVTVFINITDVKNPKFIGTSDIQIYVYTKNDEAIDSMTIEVGSDQPCGITFVYKIDVTQTFVLQENSQILFIRPDVIMEGTSVGYMIIEYPSAFTFTEDTDCQGNNGVNDPDTVTCNVVNNILTTSQLYQTNTNIALEIKNFINPPNSKITDFYKVATYNSQDKLVCENNEFTTYSALPNKILVQQSLRNSSQVGDEGPYKLKFSTSTQMPQGSQIRLIIPEDQVWALDSIQCKQIDGNIILQDSICSEQTPTNSNTFQFLMTEWCSSSGSCPAETYFQINLENVQNPEFFNPEVSSSIQIYILNPTMTGVIDQVIADVQFQPLLEPKPILDLLVGREGHTVGEDTRFSFSFTTMNPYSAGSYVRYEFLQGVIYPDDQGKAIDCEYLGSSTSCVISSQHSDESIQYVDFTSICVNECSEGLVVEVAISDVENPITIKEIERPITVSTYTYQGYIIDQGDSTDNISQLQTNSILGLKMTRSSDKIKSSISIDIQFTHSTEIPTTGQIQMQFPEKVIVLQTDLTVYRLSDNEELAFSKTENNGSIIEISVQGYCTNECLKGQTIHMRFHGLKTLDSVEEISGEIDVTTSNEGYSSDYGLFEAGDILASLTPGQLYNIDIHPFDPTVSTNTRYRIIFTTEHTIPIGAVITLKFPTEITLQDRDISDSFCSEYLTIQSTIQCQITSNTLKVTNGFYQQYQGSHMIGFWVNNIVNPSSPGILNNFELSILTQDLDIINSDSVQVTYYVHIQDQQCVDYCEHCAGEDSTCYSCGIPSQNPLLFEYSCGAECPSDFFLVESDYTCIRCHYTCSSCISEKASQCVECALGYVKSDGYCVTVCPSGTSLNSDGVCQNISTCTSPCQKCSDSQTYCLQCQDQTPVLYQQEGHCVQQGDSQSHFCPSGYYEDSNVCKECFYQCLTCIGTSDHCSSCLQIYGKDYLNKLDNTCVSECPAEISVQDQENKTCQPCFQACSTCSGTESTDCETCPSSGTKFYTPSSECVETCPAQTYHYDQQDGTFSCIDQCFDDHYIEDSTQYCIPCLETCQTCSDGSTCDSCNQYPFLTSEGECVNQCDSDHYEYTLNNQQKCFSDQCPSGSVRFDNGTKTCIEPQDCPQTSYFLTTDGKDCSQCDTSCVTCQGESSSDCLTCQSQEFLTADNQCADDCPSDQYKYGQQCYFECPDDLLHYDISSTEKVCIETCYEQHYTEQSTHYCIPCYSSCQTCTGPDYQDCSSCTQEYPYLTQKNECLAECTSELYTYDYFCYSTCPSGTYHYVDTQNNKICIEQCVDGYYSADVPTATEGDNQSYCYLCHSTCKTCEGSSSNDCLTCTEAYSYYDIDTHECKSDCGSKFLYQSQCMETCPEGTLHYEEVGENLCIEDCAAGNYVDDDTDYCIPCYLTCQTCDGGSSQNCLTCDSSGSYPYLSQAGTCKSSCSSTEYLYTSGDEQRCYDTCPSGTYGYSETMKCVQECPSGYFKSGSLCEECYQTCFECTSGSSNSCISCIDGYTYFTGSCLAECPQSYRQENGICVMDCNQTICETCKINDLSYCTDCDDGFALHEGYCYSTCPTGYYKESQSCLLCDSSCYTCSGSTSSDCTSCNGLYYYNQQCIQECPEGYEARNGICQEPCQSPCQTCEDYTVDDCTSCISSHQYLFQKRCYENCPDGYYPYQSSCVECDQTCATCTGPSEEECQTCSETLLLNPDGTCQELCPQNYIANSNTMTCDSTLSEIPEKDQSEEQEPETYVIYALIVQLVILCLLILITRLHRPDTFYRSANILSLLTISQFSYRLLLVVFIWIQAGTLSALLLAVGGAVMVGTSVVSILFLYLHLDSLVESSTQLQDFVYSNKKSYCIIKFFTWIFGVHFIRILYSGFFGTRITTGGKTLAQINAFRTPLERLSFYYLLMIQIPEMILCICVCALHAITTNSAQIALFGGCLNLFLSIYYFINWHRGPWRQ